MSKDNRQAAAILAAARMQSIHRGQSLEAWVDEYERFLAEMDRRDDEASQKATAEYLNHLEAESKS